MARLLAMRLCSRTFECQYAAITTNPELSCVISLSFSSVCLQHPWIWCHLLCNLCLLYLKKKKIKKYTYIPQKHKQCYLGTTFNDYLCAAASVTRGNNNTQCRETAPRLFPSVHRNGYFRIEGRRVIFTPRG